MRYKILFYPSSLNKEHSAFRAVSLFCKVCPLLGTENFANSSLTGLIISKGPKGPKDPQADDGKGSNVAGIVISVFIIIVLIIGTGFAIYYRKKLLQKWREYHQKSPGAKR